MKAVQGKCRFCGQYQAIEVPEKYTAEMIDEEVTKKCDCPEAKAYVKVEENVASAERAIRDFYKDREELDTLKDLMLQAVRPLAELRVDKVSVSRGGYTAYMKPTKEGIKVSLKYTTEDSVET